MPVYDYKCADHGVFNQLATFEESALPACCPQCGTPSPRVIVLAPSVLAMAREKKQAMERNEAARHEPIVSTTDSRMEQAQRQQRRCGCGHQHQHGHHSHPEKVNGLSSRTMLYTADGGKIFPSARPWMISH